MDRTDHLSINSTDLSVYRLAETTFCTSVIQTTIALLPCLWILLPTLLRSVLAQVLTPTNSVLHMMYLSQTHHSISLTRIIIECKNLSLNGSTPITVFDISKSYILHALYVDHSDNVYLSIRNSHMVLLFHAHWNNFSIVAGTGVQGPSNTQLDRPYGIFVNQAGTIYVADWANHRVMMWFSKATSGIIVAGNGTLGSSSTQLSSPTQIIVDENEYMYISEAGNGRITRWAVDGTFGVCIAACTGRSGIASTQLGQATLSRIRSQRFPLRQWLCETIGVQKFEILDFCSK